MTDKEEKRRTYISIGELFEEPPQNSLLPLHKRFDEMNIKVIKNLVSNRKKLPFAPCVK